MAKRKITTKEEALAAVRKDGDALKDVSEELKTVEVCLEAVRQHGLALRFVPKNLMTESPEKFGALCLEAVKQDRYALDHVPKSLRTAEVYLEVVKQAGGMLEDVPEKLKTVELCFEAVKQNGRALEYLPKEPITEWPNEFGAIFLKAVKDSYHLLQYVPENFKTAEMCLMAVKKHGWALQYVPEKLKTAKLCLAALKDSAGALEYVPENLKTAEACLEAVSDGKMLAYVPENLKTAELCLEAVKHKGSLKYVPENLRTAEICFAAMKLNGSSVSELQYVPWGQLNLTDPAKTELCYEAFKQSAEAFQYVPENVKTAEFCLEAMKKGGSLQYVPWGQLNLTVPAMMEMCLEAVKQNDSALQYVPWGQLNLTDPAKIGIYLEAVKYNNRVIRNTPEYHGMKHNYAAGYRAAIEQIFREMPEELRDEARIRLKNEGEWLPDNLKQYAAEVNIGALTQEAIRFELGKLSERALNSVPPDTPYRNFSLISDFVADKINIFVIIPDHREVPKSIVLKLTNIGKTAEQKEAVIDCNGRFAKAELEGIAILQAEQGRPRPGTKYRQKTEITLNFENRSEMLVCPISRTTTFSMCFYEAYEAQGGRIDSVGSIYDFT